MSAKQVLNMSSHIWQMIPQRHLLGDLKTERESVNYTVRPNFVIVSVRETNNIQQKMDYIVWELNDSHTL